MEFPVRWLISGLYRKSLYHNREPVIRRWIIDFLIKILGTIPEKCQLPVLSPKNRFIPEVSNGEPVIRRGFIPCIGEKKLILCVQSFAWRSTVSTRRRTWVSWALGWLRVFREMRAFLPRRSWPPSSTSSGSSSTTPSTSSASPPQNYSLSLWWSRANIYSTMEQVPHIRNINEFTEGDY